MTTTPNDLGTQIAKQIVDWEARRDANGNIEIYDLPGNDGGGRFEVAGINEKYDGPIAIKLAAMAPQDREAAAVDYIKRQTDAVAQWSDNPGVQAFLRDTMFNRGQGGAARILQSALGVSVDGQVGPKTMAALQDQQQDPAALLQRLRQAREDYEYKHVGYRANLDAGLRNRWNNALAYSQSLLG